MVDDAKEAVFPRHNRADVHMDSWRLYPLLVTQFLLLSEVLSLLSSVGHRQGLLEKRIQTPENSSKNWQLVLLKFKSICSSRQTMNRVKRQPQWEQTLCQLHICQEINNLNRQLKNSSIPKYHKSPNQKKNDQDKQRVLKEDAQMNIYEKCSLALAIWEMQIRSVRRFCLTPGRMAIMKRAT